MLLTQIFISLFYYLLKLNDILEIDNTFDYV